MPVYKKKVSTRDPRFHNRTVGVYGLDENLNPTNGNSWPVEDTTVLCNSCNDNIYNPDEETYGWLIYFDKRDVRDDYPYDFYCDSCTKRNFPKAQEVT